MILLVCKIGTEHSGEDEYSLASIAQYSFDYKPMEYGFTYNAFSKTPPPPQIQLAENIFITSHDVEFNETLGEFTIGDYRQKTEFSVSTIQLFDQIKPLLPNRYSGSVYISACLESDRSTASFADSFNILMQQAFSNSQAYGRKSGTVTADFDGGCYPIIPPSSDY